jgi:hypothetical protein
MQATYFIRRMIDLLESACPTMEGPTSSRVSEPEGSSHCQSQGLKIVETLIA